MNLWLMTSTFHLMAVCSLLRTVFRAQTKTTHYLSTQYILVLSDVPVYLYFIHAALNLINEYTITTNTNIYLFLININSTATCFDQMLVIFRHEKEIKI